MSKPVEAWVVSLGVGSGDPLRTRTPLAVEPDNHSAWRRGRTIGRDTASAPGTPMVSKTMPARVGSEPVIRVTRSHWIGPSHSSRTRGVRIPALARPPRRVRRVKCARRRGCRRGSRRRLCCRAHDQSLRPRHSRRAPRRTRPQMVHEAAVAGDARDGGHVAERAIDRLGLGDGSHHLQRPYRRQHLMRLVRHLRERAAAHEFHRDIDEAALVADRERRHDRRVGERRGRARLA